MANILDHTKSRAFTKAWFARIRRRSVDIAKTKTPAWFGGKFNARYTPLNIQLNKNARVVYIWGSAPNMNYNKSEATAKRVKIPRGEPRPHVFIRESHFLGNERVFGKRGVWLTLKTQPRTKDGSVYTKTSHETRFISGAKYRKGKDARKYPFPVEWRIENGRADFQYCDQSVSDKLLESDDFYASIDEAYDEVLEDYTKHTERYLS